MDHASFLLSLSPGVVTSSQSLPGYGDLQFLVVLVPAQRLSPHHSRNQRECPLALIHDIKDMHSSQGGMRPQASEGEYFGAKTAHMSSHKSLSRNQVSNHSTEPRVTLEHSSHI